MLWIDTDFISQSDLSSVDPDIVNVATSENVTLLGDNSTTRRAIETAGNYLEGRLISFATYISSNDLSANHLAAVFYTGSQPNQRRRVTIDQFVVTNPRGGSSSYQNYWSDIKQWVVNRALIEFYLAVSNRAQNDRYDEKLDKFRLRDEREMWPRLSKSGCPIVYRPMPAPAAAQWIAPGAWSASATAGPGTYVGEVDVAITWVDQQYYVSYNSNGNRESGPSAIQSVTLATGQVLNVDIAGLNPPGGNVNPAELARGFMVPGTATGWNLYVGTHGGTRYLQNSPSAPIPIRVIPAANPSQIVTSFSGTTSYTMPGDPQFTQYPVGIGQYPDAYLTFPNLFSRA
jgi:hypothetical protein